MEETGSKHIDQLVSLAVEGNGFAFTALWDAYIAKLRAFVRNFLGDVDGLTVDDICSRSFEKAFRQISTFDPSKGNFYTWLKAIARNTSLDVIEQERKNLGNTVYLDADEQSFAAVADSLADSVESPLESIISTEQTGVNESCIEALPELYREVARKRFVDGLQYKEIAEEMSLELNTVRTRIRRAKSLLDKMAKEKQED